MSLMTKENISVLVALATEQILAYARSWPDQGTIVLYNALHEPLTRAACLWAGVPMTATETKRRTRQLTALFNSAATIGLPHWHSRLSRKATNRWATDVITRIRAERIHPAPGSASHIIAWHRDANGELLSPKEAAVELLNLLRPFNFIPQGGGEHTAGHRCAGEWITIELMKATAELLATRIDYTVPEQDVSIDMTRMPALPHSRFRISGAAVRN